MFIEPERKNFGSSEGAKYLTWNKEHYAGAKELFPEN